MTMFSKNNTNISQQLGWRFFLPIIVIYLLLFTALFNETFGSMVSIWLRSETFTHAFLILPISIWLVWEKREHLKYVCPQPSWLGMIALSGSGFLWLFGYLVDALVVQQFAWVAAFISGIWAILGNRVVWAIAFPLAFLVFLIPFGEDLVPAMMNFTADFTVALVRLTGIPVYREGLFFTLPSGNWSVVEACSGIRYLIASLTLGCLYAYLTYTSLKKRLIFILISIVVPIIANGLRAYIIVMLGHMSDMTLATGVDHLVYGWVFFGIVIFIMISIGSLFRDKDIDDKPEAEIVKSSAYSLPRVLQTTVFAMLLISIWPLLAYAIERSEDTAVIVPEMKPILNIKDWTSIDRARWDWKPMNTDTDEVSMYFEKEDIQVGVFLQYLFARKKGVELINSRNVILGPDNEEWRIVGQTTKSLSLGLRDLKVNEVLLRGDGTQLLVWSWYRIGEEYTANKYTAKILEGVSRLTFGRQDEGKIFITIPFNGEFKSADRAIKMQEFIKVALPEIEKMIDRVAVDIR